MTITTESYFDGREMYMLHNMFRREFGLMPGLVRAVAAGNHERTEIIAAHIEGVATVLHHHHHSEDEHVWPLLLERVPEDLAPVVRLMESQHEEVAKTAAEIDEAIKVWRGSAGAGSREALARRHRPVPSAAQGAPGRGGGARGAAHGEAHHRGRMEQDGPGGIGGRRPGGPSSRVRHVDVRR